MDKQAIKEICLKHGYKLKPQADGTQDLNAYVYDAFDEVLSHVRHGQQMVNSAKATILSDALHLIQSSVRYKHDKDLEHGLELLRSTRDELCAVPKYHDDVALVGTKQVEFANTCVYSVPYYPLDEEQVTVVCEVNKDELDNGNLKETNDPINPNHYKTNSGVECIDVAELFPYALGNAIKYAWRAGKKDNLKQDLEKCEWYLNRALANGEDSLFMGYHSSVLKARRFFAKLNKTDLPELNYELVSRILDGRLEYALIHIDDWLVGE